MGVVDFGFGEHGLDPFCELGFRGFSVDGLTAGCEAVSEGVAEGSEGVLIALVDKG